MEIGLQRTEETLQTIQRSDKLVDGAATPTTAVDTATLSLPQLLDQQALTLLEERTGQKRPAMRKGVFQAAALVLGPVCVFGVAAALFTGDWVAATTVLCIGLMAVWLWRAVLTDDVKSAGVRLTKSDDIRVVGALADMLNWPDPRYWNIAAAGLTRLLPRLKASDAHLLDENQRAAIYQRMTLPKTAGHAAFVLAALAALTQVGDEGSVPMVSRLAADPPATEKQREVHAAANECLEAITFRLQRGDVPNRLLRPAESATTPDHLLRSALAAPTPDTDRLPRLAEAE